MSVLPFKRTTPASLATNLTHLDAPTKTGIVAALPATVVQTASVSPLKAATASPRRAKRLIATLTVTPHPSTLKKSKKFVFSVGSGVLKIADKEFTHAEPVILGTAAAIAGVTSVVLIAPGLPAKGVKLNVRNWQQREVDELEQSVQYVIRQFRSGYCIAKDSHKWAREMVDMCRDARWAPAWELLPPEMRLLTGLKRGVYGDDGQPMTAKQIEQRARSKRFLDAFKGTIAKMDETGAELDKVLAGTTQLLPDVEGDPSPVVYTQEAEFVLRKLVAKYEFGMMPLTRPQLDELLQHIDNKILLGGGVALLKGV